MFDMSEYYKESFCTDKKAIKRAENTMPCDNAECGNNNNCDAPLAMVFINMQPLDSVYPLCESFENGTLFPNLDMPFLGGNAK